MSARFGDGREANKIEVSRWNKIESYPLAKIYEWDSETYDWLIMRVADPLSKETGVDTELVCQEIKEASEPYSDTLPILDVREINVGQIDGKWVLLDYGKPFIEDEYMYGLFPSAVHSFVLNSSEE